MNEAHQDYDITREVAALEDQHFARKAMQFAAELPPNREQALAIIAEVARLHEHMVDEKASAIRRHRAGLVG